MTTIDFPLDQSPVTGTLIYRPWAVRNLKVKISTDKTMPALRVRPKGVRAEEAAQGIFRAYAEDSNAFVISWGGGHEPGPCIQSEDYLMAFERCAELQPGASSVLYFNVQHVGPELPDKATMTLETYDEASGEVFASLVVTLQKPGNVPANIARLVDDGNGLWQIEGDKVAVYDPRWWPRDVGYTDLYSPLPLTVKVDGNRLIVQWDGREVAKITDHTEPTVLAPQTMSLELSDFDEWHLALRTWFFWQDTTVGKGHEVPDAERFDLLIRKADGVVTLACTDLHWREVWGKVVDGPLQATLGLSREAKLKLVKEGVGKVQSVFKREKGKDHGRVYNPVDRYIPRQAETLGKARDEVVRGKGLEAHIPSLVNIEQPEELPPRMTSSDVRLG